MKKESTKRWISLIALLGIIVAWLVGMWQSDLGNLEQLKYILPENYTINQQSEFIFKATDSDQQMIYVGIGQKKGYEGPVRCMLITDTFGTVLVVEIISHTETPSYFNKVTRSGFMDQFIKQPVRDILQNTQKLDAISGATYTSMAISNSVIKAATSLAKEVFKLPVPDREKPVFYLSFLDVLILLFFIAVIISRKLKPKLKRRIRYAILIVSVISLGFTYNFHLSISRFNALILGYWPDITIHLAWYLLVFGTILLTILHGKNPYCQWFCPFGAVQEGIGKIGKRHIHISRKSEKILLWIPRLIAWLAIVIAFLFRNPGMTSYEVFGKFFTLTGSDLLFVLTLISLIFSLFINRPWCRYLCPVPPVLDYIVYTRKQTKSLWQIKK